MLIEGEDLHHWVAFKPEETKYDDAFWEKGLQWKEAFTTLLLLFLKAENITKKK